MKAMTIIMSVTGCVLTGMTAIIWFVIVRFINSDKDWKSSHSMKLDNVKDNLSDKLVNLEKVVIREIATGLNSVSFKEHVAEVASIKNDLTKLKVKVESSDIGKVVVLEKKVDTLVEVMTIMSKRKRRKENAG